VHSNNGDSTEDDAEGHGDDGESMEEDKPVEHGDADASMEEADAEGNSKDVPMADAGACSDDEAQDFESKISTLPELAAKYPSFVLKKDWTPASNSVSPETQMIAILVGSLDPRCVTDHRTLLRTCRLLQLGWLPGFEKPLPKYETTSIPGKLADFIKQCSKVKGLPFVFAELAREWLAACKDIDGGEVWRPLADALFADVFKRLCSYDAVKEWFQRSNFKVMEWATYCHVNSQGQVFPRTEPQLHTNYQNQYFWEIKKFPKTNKVEAGVKINSEGFLKRWVKDGDMRTYERVDCIPPSKTGSVVPAGVYNIWKDFRASTLAAVPADRVDKLIEPVLWHIRNVICANEKEAQYLLAWLAQHLQDPARKTEVAIILTGAHGSGKDIIFTWYIEFLLGTDVGLQIGRASHILGDHATALQNKVLCVLDEANFATLKPHVELLKDVITGKTLQLNPKGKDMFVTRSIVNLLLTTNHDEPIPLDAGDRRWMALECNDSKKGDTAYFDGLGKNLDDTTARAFYQYLLKFDLSDYGNFQAKRPHTRIYQEMMESNLSVFHNFLSHECMRNLGEKPMFSPVENEVGGSTEKPEKTPEKPEPCTSGGIFAKFKSWAGDANLGIDAYAKTRLGKDFTNLMKKNDSGVTKKRSTLKGVSGNIYTIEWSKLEKCLKRYGLFNSNV
jgi:hypothetical protein